MQISKKFATILILVVCCIFLGTPNVFGAPITAFEGEGTKEAPYQIQSYEDLCQFRDLVNSGNRFKNTYFLQTDNIDLQKNDWTPIGIFDSGNYFYGVYDGGGHYLENLYIGAVYEKEKEEKNKDKESDKKKKTDEDEEDDDKEDTVHGGLFGSLGGTIVNLGIESGEIKGELCGAFASTSKGENAAIIDCYNKAKINSYYAGGIAGSFAFGDVVACWSNAPLKGKTVGGILALGGDLKMYGCYTTNSEIAPDDVIKGTSYTVGEKELYSSDFATKFSCTAALSQYLFANTYNVNVLQWELEHDKTLTYSNDQGFLLLFHFINIYLLPLLLLLIILLFYAKSLSLGKDAFMITYKKQLVAMTLISFWVAFFVDTALINKGFSYLNVGNGSFIALINGIFLYLLVLCGKNYKPKFHYKKEYLPLTGLLVLVGILQLFQFDLVPKFDANIYYGSFIQAIELFRLDFLTYIGAFVCWKWAHGLFLLLAPFEFLMTGEMIGVYIANMLITAVALICFYWLLRKVFVNISPILATLSCGILVFSPYALGMFTYLCMDTHLAFFIVFLLCAYKMDNDYLIAFSGFLLCFTKISGLFFYAFFLIAATLVKILSNKDCGFAKSFGLWWNWKKVLLWIIPAVFFVLCYISGDTLIMQNFYGTYQGGGIGLKHDRGLANTFLQSYVYGFRWLFLVILFLMVIVLIAKRKKIKKILSLDGLGILIGLTIGCLVTLFFLCINEGDAECPRYTAMFNCFYAFSFPFALQVLLRKEVFQKVLASLVVALLLVQTYWTIDPAILCLGGEKIDTGKKEIHKLAMAKDIRLAMNLGTNYGPKVEVMGDLYTYNLEHSFYDDLLDQALEKINPTEDDHFYLLDIIYYETHMIGNRYNIYWNSRLQNRTYDGEDKDSIYLKNEKSITTEELTKKSIKSLSLEDTFYLMVVDRVDERKAIKALEKAGYNKTLEIHPENIYGKMSVYKFEKE